MNKIIGFSLAFLYFANYHICNLVHPNDVPKFWDLKVSIYCLIIILALNYNRYIIGVKGLIESVFMSIVINNIIVHYFFGENNYSYSDLIVIPLIITIEYAKHYKINIREYLHSIVRGWDIGYFNNKKEK
jgi:hypothetical protein